MKLLMIYIVAAISSAIACAGELRGIQNIKCGERVFKVTSITTISPTELIDSKNIVHDVRSDGIGQGGAYEWACIRFDKSYLVFRGSTTVRLSDSEAIQLNVHDVFDTVSESFVKTNGIGKYFDLLENHKSTLAKKQYPKLDSIYRRARFKRFNFELPD